MQAVILAGGLGTRLRPFTESIPKGMVSVGNRPFLEHQILHLREQGIEEILLLVGYLAETIIGAFGDGSQCGVHISYSREATPLGTAGALKMAQSKLEHEFLLLNGDTYLPITYADVTDTFRTLQPLGLVVAFRNKDADTKSNLAVSPDMRVLDTHLSGGHLTHVNAGVMVFSRRILDFIVGERMCSLEGDLFPQLIRMRALWAYETQVPFYDMGTHSGLRRLEKVLGAADD